MTGAEIAAMSGFDLTKRLNEKYRTKEITLEQYKKIKDYWLANHKKTGQQKLITEDDVREVFGDLSM
jgi:gamma-glutamyltranspeptidase